MPSSFSWLDYSESERRKVSDVISLLNEKTTVDEIGIGSVRDTFADFFFPGISTIQTTIKYFLLIPWTYLTIENKRVGCDRIAEQGRRLESKIVDALVESGATHGVIGRVAGENILRLPSETYWQGLSLWGIRKFVGSRDQYHRSIDDFYDQLRIANRVSADFDGEGADAQPVNWDRAIPPVPPDFPKNIQMRLSLLEADYLQNRICLSCPDSLLGFIVRERVPVSAEMFAWQLNTDFPEPLRSRVLHGKLFSETMLGAQLLYNLILAEIRSSGELIERYRARLTDWCETMQAMDESIKKWNLADFWDFIHLRNPRVPLPARRFIDQWLDVVRRSVNGIEDNANLRALIKQREYEIKGNLARSRGGRPLEIWSGESGTAAMDYRWLNARPMLIDLFNGLQENRTDAAA